MVEGLSMFGLVDGKGDVSVTGHEFIHDNDEKNEKVKQKDWPEERNVEKGEKGGKDGE